MQKEKKFLLLILPLLAFCSQGFAEETEEPGFEYSGKIKMISAYHREGVDETNGYSEMEVDQNFVYDTGAASVHIQVEVRPKFGDGLASQTSYFGFGTGESEKVFKLEQAYLEFDFLNDSVSFEGGLISFDSPGGTVFHGDAPGFMLSYHFNKDNDVYVNFLKERERDTSYSWDDIQVINVGCDLEFADVFELEAGVYTRFGTTPSTGALGPTNMQRILTFIPSLALSLDFKESIGLEVNLGGGYGQGKWSAPTNDNYEYETYEGYTAYADADYSVLEKDSLKLNISAFGLIWSGDTNSLDDEDTYWTSLINQSEDGVFYDYTSYFLGGGYEYFNVAGGASYAKFGVISFGGAVDLTYKDLYAKLTVGTHRTSVASEYLGYGAGNEALGSEINSYFKYEIVEDVYLNLQADVFFPGLFYDVAVGSTATEFAIAGGPSFKW